MKKQRKKIRKGFTLIELLAVIVVLAIILIIAIPRIANIIQNSRMNAYEIQEKLMVKAAQNYFASRPNELPKKIDEEKEITLTHLIGANFIETIKDPQDKKTECTGKITIKKISSKKYEYNPSLMCGDNYVTPGFGEELSGNHLTEVPEGYTGIYKIEDLNNIRNALAGNYILMNDLDFNNNNSYEDSNNMATYTTNEGWLPIGSDWENYFSGVFDGNNYVIRNLYINRPENDYIGLFGNIDDTPSIRKLGLEDIDIKGSTNIGGIVGISYSGNIENVYVTGAVEGNQHSVGGIVGYSYNYTDISNAYTDVDVKGTYHVGGIMGRARKDSNIKDSFALGNITATDVQRSYDAGYLVGSVDPDADIIRSFYSYSSSYDLYDPTSTPRTYAVSIDDDFLKSELFINNVLDWDIETIWKIEEPGVITLGGNTELQYPHTTEITKIEELLVINKDLTETYTLMNDLDFENDSDYRNVVYKEIFTNELGFLPIALNREEFFSGIFNGNGNIIKNLYINRPEDNYIGLFSEILSSSLIEHLGIEDANITGGMRTGILTGEARGTIKNIYVTGEVVGTSHVGGIAGIGSGALDFTSVIEDSYSLANINATSSGGSGIGYVSNIQLNRIFAAGDVTVSIPNQAWAGILIGNDGSSVSVNNCYKSEESTVTMPYGSPTYHGTLTSVSNLQNLSVTGLNTWDTTNIWQINSGAYPTFR